MAIAEAVTFIAITAVITDLPAKLHSRSLFIKFAKEFIAIK